MVGGVGAVVGWVGVVGGNVVGVVGTGGVTFMDGSKTAVVSWDSCQGRCAL